MQRKQRKEEMGCQVARGEAELSTTVNGSTVQLGAHFLPLRWRQRGAVAADPPVDQAGEPMSPVPVAPLHEPGATAASDVLDVRHRITSAIQPHRLVTGARGAVFGTLVRLP